MGHLNLEGLIPILGGIYCWLVATGKMRASKDPMRDQEWRERWGRMMRILSPIVIGFGLLLLFGLLL